MLSASATSRLYFCSISRVLSSRSLMRFCEAAASWSAAICACTIVSNCRPFFSSAAPAGQTVSARKTAASADLRVPCVISVSFRLQSSQADRARLAATAAAPVLLLELFVDVLEPGIRGRAGLLGAARLRKPVARLAELAGVVVRDAEQELPGARVVEAALVERVLERHHRAVPVFLQQSHLTQPDVERALGLQLRRLLERGLGLVALAREDPAVAEQLVGRLVLLEDLL